MIVSLLGVFLGAFFMGFMAAKDKEAERAKERKRMCEDYMAKNGWTCHGHITTRTANCTKDEHYELVPPEFDGDLLYAVAKLNGTVKPDTTIDKIVVLLPCKKKTE